MRLIYLAPLLCLPLGGCPSAGTVTTASNAATTATTDTVSALDAAVQALTQIDKGITLYAELPACSASLKTGCSNAATVAKLKQEAAAARTALETAQGYAATAAQASAAFAAMATIAADFAAL